MFKAEENTGSVKVKEEVRSLSFFFLPLFHSCIAAAGQGACVEYLGLECMGR